MPVKPRSVPHVAAPLSNVPANTPHLHPHVAPSLYPLRLIGVLAYGQETLALFEDGSDTFYKRPGDILVLRDSSRWRLLSVAEDRVQLERITTDNGKDRRLLTAKGSVKPAKPSEPERIALILGE